MGDKAKVSQIVVQFPDGSTKAMSVEDARGLYKQLEELFGIHYVQPNYPIIIERERWPRWWDGTVTVSQYINEPSRTTAPLPQVPTIWCCAEYC